MTCEPFSDLRSVFAIAVAEALPVRKAAYFPNEDVPLSRVQLDCDDDPNTLHFGLMHDGRCIGVGAVTRCAPSPRTQHDLSWRLRGMAVLPEFQGLGLGRMVLDYAVARVANSGGGLMWANIRRQAYGFYERNNFLLHDDVYFIHAGSNPHRYGERVIPAA